MKFTFSWLCDHLNTEHTLEDICGILPMLGLEVENIDDPSRHHAPFRVAEIITAEAHPDAERLRICQVKVSDQQPLLQIVCGAANAIAGLKTVLAPVGTWIPGSDIVIKAGKIRGQASQGMLCSPSELGLGTEHDGIIELAPIALIGTSLQEYGREANLASLDPVIDIAITPNRGDCLGVRGIARDLAAAGYGTLKPLDFSPAKGSFESNITWKIDPLVASYVPLISGRMFENVNNQPSPQWLANRLLAIGMRPISALVDITNYVMVDLGRPLHAFDADKIIGGELMINLANEGGTLLALNEKTYQLQDHMLVIGDAEGPDDIAGIMGGSRTAISDTTTRMFLEIAIFDPICVARAGRHLNLHSEARFRFERGLDQASPIEMAGYIARFVQSICGGEFSHLVVAGERIDKNKIVKKKMIAFSPDRTTALTGITCPDNTQSDILRALGFEIENENDQSSKPSWQVSVPTWRGDIMGAADLIEEIIRIYGYDKLALARLPRSEAIAKPAVSRAQKRAILLRRLLAGRGMIEAVTFSFLRESDASHFGGGGEEMGLANPISADLNFMRPSILPNLLHAAARNLNRGAEDISLFEIGPVFLNPSETGQRIGVAGIRHGRRQLADWQQSGRACDLFDAKADLEACLSLLSVQTKNLRVSEDGPKWMHPGRAGCFYQGRDNLGYFGELHPGLAAHFDLPRGTIGFEFWLENVPLPRRKSPAKKGLELSPFQPVSRDYAFIVDHDMPAWKIIDAVRRGARDVVEQVTIFDVYQGKGIAEGKKSVALTVKLQPQKATFSDAELSAIAEQIITIVAKNCGGQLRAS